MPRKATLLVACLLPMLALGLPPGAAQGEDGWSHTDGLGDVHVLGPDAPQLPERSPLSDLVDIQSVRFHRETGLDFQIEYKLGSLQFQMPQTRLPVLHMICFEVKDVTVAVRATYSYGEAGTPESLFASLLRMPGGTCDVAYNGPQEQVDVLVEIPENLIRFIVPKPALAKMVGDAATLSMGDTVAGIQAHSRGIQAAGTPNFALADSAPNDGPSTEGLTFQFHIHNGDLRVSAPTATQFGVLQCSGLRRPVITVEGGSYQGIPILLENALPTGVRPDVWATVTPAGWEAKIIPRIDVAPASDAAPGNVTVTLIVKSPSRDEKHCAEVRVFAMDPAEPTRMGELVLDVVSSPRLNPERNSVYLHTRPDVQTPPRIWMNAAPEDPQAHADMAIRLVPPRNAQAGSSTAFQIQAKSDGVYPYDILLEADGTVVSSLFVTSDPVPTNARFILELTSGGEILASGEAEGTIPVAGTEFPVNLIVDPDVWKSPVRRAAGDAPLGLTIRYEPTGAVPAFGLTGGQGSGYVDLVPGRSHLELPIVDTLVTKDVRLGEAGGLVSLRLDNGPSTKLTNEARGNYFNYTITNEGVAVDSFRLDLNATASPAANWTVQRVPDAHLDRIAPGEQGTFSLLVIAPPTAPEGAELQMRVTLASKTDDAAASSLVTVKVAKQQEHGLVLDLPTKAAKDTPAPTAWTLIVMTLLASLAMRRRR